MKTNMKTISYQTNTTQTIKHENEYKIAKERLKCKITKIAQDCI